MLGSSQGVEEQATLSLMNGGDLTNKPTSFFHKFSCSWITICDCRRLPFRSLILILVCATTIGSFYSFNSTAAIATSLIQELKMSQAEYGLLYSIYSIPNLVLPLFGGLFIDRVGVRIGIILYLGLIAAGTGIVAVAPYMPKPFVWMMIGRFIFGLGSESSYVAQDTLIVIWFRGRSLAFAMGMMSAVERAAEVFTFNSLSYFHPYQIALWFTFGICLFSLFSALIVSGLDKYGEKKLTALGHPPRVTENSKVKFSDITQLPISYWLLTLIMLTFYSTIFPFLSFGSDFLQLQYGYSVEQAGQVISLLSLISMVLSPILGIAIDAIGKRIHLVNLGNVLLLIAFLLLAYSSLTPIVAVILIGIAYSLIGGAVWPALPIVVDEKLFATASGLSLSLSNIGMIPSYYVVGHLIDQFHSTQNSLVFLAVISLAGLIIGIVWHFVDVKDGGPCNSVWIECEDISTVSGEESATQSNEEQQTSKNVVPLLDV